MRVSTVHSTVVLWVFASASSYVIAQGLSNSVQKPALPPGAVALVNQDRFGSRVALCAETGEPEVRQGAKRVRGTGVWAGERTNLRRIHAGLGACDPAWSPDGRRLAVTAADGLWVFPANSADGMLRVESRLPQGATEFNYRAFSGPQWSPDGTLVAVVVTNGGTAWVEVFDANSGRLFYTSPPENYTFSWSSARDLKLEKLEIHLPRR